MQTFIAQTERERQLIRELNSSNKEIEDLRYNLSRAKARIAQLESALRTTPVQSLSVPADKASTTVLQPGEKGYKTIVRTTAQGRRFVNNPALYTGPAAAQFVMTLGTHANGAELEKLETALKPYAVSRAQLIYAIKLLNKVAYIEVDYVKVS